MEKYCNYLVDWLINTAQQAHMDTMVVGLSGGIDSAVVAGLLKKAFGDRAKTYILPCESSAQDIDDALLVASALDINYEIIDLTETYHTLIKNFEQNANAEGYRLALGNTKARLRMTTLYANAQINKALVCGTDNRDEWYVGYFTKHGDGGVDVVPLVHLTKRQVRQLARYLNIPDAVIRKSPTAGLFEGQTDEEELGLTYDQIDDYLEGMPTTDHVKDRLLHLHAISMHKRQLAKQPEFSLEELMDV